jgi:hypothetical protein
MKICTQKTTFTQDEFEKICAAADENGFIELNEDIFLWARDRIKVIRHKGEDFTKSPYYLISDTNYKNPKGIETLDELNENCEKLREISQQIINDYHENLKDSKEFNDAFCFVSNKSQAPSFERRILLAKEILRLHKENGVDFATAWLQSGWISSENLYKHFKD